MISPCCTSSLSQYSVNELVPHCDNTEFELVMSPIGPYQSTANNAPHPCESDSNVCYPVGGYCLVARDSDSYVRIQKLNGQNYALWQTKMRLVLEHDDLWLTEI